MIYLCIDNFTDFKKDNYYKFNLFIYNKKIEYFKLDNSKLLINNFNLNKYFILLNCSNVSKHQNKIYVAGFPIPFAERN